MTRAGLALGIAVLSMAASCATPAGSGQARVLALDDEGLRVGVPAEWDAMRSGDAGFGPGRVLFYLSNQPLRTDCVQAMEEQGCTLPVAGLVDGGIILLWATTLCAGPGCALPDGERRLISGREAAVGPETGMCDSIGATEEDDYAVTVTPQRVDWIVICARSPQDEEHAALASILDAVEWLTP